MREPSASVIKSLDDYGASKILTQNDCCNLILTTYELVGQAQLRAFDSVGAFPNEGDTLEVIVRLHRKDGKQ